MLGQAAGDGPGVAAVIRGGTADRSDIDPAPVQLNAHIASRKIAA